MNNKNRLAEIERRLAELERKMENSDPDPDCPLARLKRLVDGE